MDFEYYKECLSKYANSSEEDAIKVLNGAVEMEIIDGIGTGTEDKVAHQASIILSLERYNSDKDACLQEICYNVCTADCEIDRVMDKCRDFIYNPKTGPVEEDVATLCRLRLMSRQSKDKELGRVCDEIQRAYLLQEKPEYSVLKSDIDYMLFDLLDVIDLRTESCKLYVSTHREQFIRPIMDMVLTSGDVILMSQMKQIYNNWMEWR